MNKTTTLIIIFFFLFSLAGIVVADSIERSLDIIVEIKGSVLAVEISESSLNLGEITAGYQTESQNFTIKNTGNTKLYITASANETSAPLIANYLKLNRYANCASNGWKILNDFDLTLERPTEYAGQGDPQLVCTKLDLTNYTEPTIDAQTINEELTFWIAAI